MKGGSRTPQLPNFLTRFVSLFGPQLVAKPRAGQGTTDIYSENLVLLESIPQEKVHTYIRTF